MDLANRRRALGLSRECLSEIAGITYWTLDRIERNQRRPRPDEQLRIDLVLSTFERARAEACAAVQASSQKVA